MPAAQVLAALPKVTDALDVHAAAPAVLPALAAMPQEDRVHVHGDLGLQDLTLAPDSDAVLGAFDSGEACLELAGGRVCVAREGAEQVRDLVRRPKTRSTRATSIG